jgi:DNA-directed RNA polymerase specialized sigma24 family protein
MTNAAAAAAPLMESPSLVVEDRCAPTIIERIMREAGPYLQRAAAHIANDFPAAAEDMVQEAWITLWELDIGRFPQRDAAYLERILCTRMIQVYRTECRGGLTSGWGAKKG